MSTTLDFSGKVCALSGRFPDGRYTLTGLLQKKGARVTSTVSTRTDILITGQRPGERQYLAAQHAGALILTEAQALAALEGEAIDLPEEHKFGLNDLLGTARSLMARPVSPELWSEIVELVDQCSDEELEPLVDYIARGMSTWSKDAMVGMRGNCLLDAHLDSAQGGRLAAIQEARYHVPDELRVAPIHWLGEVVKDRPAHKLRLVRALDLRASKLPQTMLKRLLEHPDLTNLAQIFLSEQKTPSKTLFESVLNHRNGSRLEVLGLGKIDRNMALMLQSAKRLETLETLDISCIYVPKQNEHYALDLLAKAPRFFFVKTLIIKGHSTYFPTRVVREHAAHFPFLNTLRLRRYFPTANRLRRLRETRILRHVHTFDPGPLCFDGRVQEQWEAILKIKLPKNVHTLDLSGLHIQNASSRANTMQEVIEHVFTTLASSDLLEHIETLHLGKWLDDDTATRTLDQHGATLTL